MSIVTLERLRLRMEREFFAGALADLAAAESLLTSPGAAPPPEWPSLPAARAALRAEGGAPSARRLTAALRRDRAGLQRRLAALMAEFGAGEPWVTAAAARLAERPRGEAAPGRAHLDPAHA